MPMEAFTVGILHDIGKVVVLQKFPQVATLVYQQLLKNGEDDVNPLEMKHLGYTHQLLGGLLLEWWDFPFAIVEAALYHHDPLNDHIINKNLIGTLHIADEIAQVKVGMKAKPKFNLDVLDALDIDLQSVETLMDTVVYNGMQD